MHPPTLRAALLLLVASAALLALGTQVGAEGLERHGWRWDALVTELRLPRSLAAWACGALLGLAGALAQGLFRNPLADPYLIGTSAGATLAVALTLVALASPSAAAWLPLLHPASAGLALHLAAFSGALLALLGVLLLARGAAHTPRLLLTGVVVGVVLAAATQGLSLRHPALLQPLQAFMLGSTSLLGREQAVVALGVGALCLALAWVGCRTLDALSLGERTAQSLGLPLARDRRLLLTSLALATGVAVAHCGLVAFVGLLAPHAVRSLGVATHRSLLPLASLAGGVLLLGADIAARWVWAPLELPVGLPTALLGGLYLLARMRRLGGVS